MSKINCSNRVQDFKMVLRDKLCLQNAVPHLQKSEHRHTILGHSDRTISSWCCGRDFHYTCVVDMAVCPYCNEGWGGGGGGGGRVPYVVCGLPTVRHNDRELFFTYKNCVRQ